MGERISMSAKDLERFEVLKEIFERRLKQARGAKKLGVTPRHLRRLLCRFKEQGPKGIISRKLGAPGNRQLPQEQKGLILSFFQNQDHRDFGPTLAHEYLVKDNGLRASISSVRTVMIQNGLWDSKRIRKAKMHYLRPRRPKKGELVQLDGSEHDWFEGRGARTTLLVYIDDATSEILHLKFVRSENTVDYFQATREYLEKCGRPEAFYLDKHSVFRVNRTGALSGDGRTQFGRAMDTLGIKLICANSPQAKGRVERRNRDLQNRLVKAMRIAKICSIEAANAFVPGFLETFNQKFAKAPKDPHNAHKPLSEAHDLDRIFSLQYKRRLSKTLTLQYNSVLYQVIAPDRLEYTLKGVEVTVVETGEGGIPFEYRGKPLEAVSYHQMEAPPPEVSSKELVEALLAHNPAKQDLRYKPKSRRHPWKSGPRGFSKRTRTLAYC